MREIPSFTRKISVRQLVSPIQAVRAAFEDTSGTCISFLELAFCLYRIFCRRFAGCSIDCGTLSVIFPIIHYPYGHQPWACLSWGAVNTSTYSHTHIHCHGAVSLLSVLRHNREKRANSGFRVYAEIAFAHSQPVELGAVKSPQQYYGESYTLIFPDAKL